MMSSEEAEERAKKRIKLLRPDNIQYGLLNCTNPVEYIQTLQQQKALQVRVSLYFESVSLSHSWLSLLLMVHIG